MKKLLFFSALIALTITKVESQIKTKTERTRLQTPSQIVNPAPAPESKATPPPAATTTKSAGTSSQATPVYSLTAVRATIRTGSDNKEFPSKVNVYVWKKGTPIGDYANNCLYYVSSLKNEMAVNSSTDIGLEKYQGNADKFSLANLQITGLEIRVSYDTNFFMDAWKVENIGLTFEFKDQNGNYHPTMGSKTISFSNAIGFLNSEYSYFKCITDQNFNPLTASIEKR
jgi:hypothetical protein